MKIDDFKLPRKYDRRVKISDETLTLMKRLYDEGYSQRWISDYLGVAPATVNYHVSGRGREALREYRRSHPCKRRTKDEQREYQSSLRAYKRQIIKGDI